VKSLTLWKDADAGIAEVEDVRKRVGGLMSHNHLKISQEIEK